MNDSVPCRVSADLRAYERQQDRLGEVTAEMETQWDAFAEMSIKDSDWWNSTLEGCCFVSSEVPRTLARCMANLDAACKGDAISTTAILTALSNLQRTARADARDEAIDMDPAKLERALEDE